MGEAHDIDITTDAPPLSSLLERSVRSGVPANQDQIVHSAHELVAPLPGFLGRVVAQVLTRISTLPTSPGSDVFAVPLEICARAYVKAGRASPLRKARLCLRDQPVIDAVLGEMSK